MKLLCLDLGTHLGWAWGDTHAHSPIVECARLAPGESVEYRTGVLGKWLSDFIDQYGNPDRIVVENFMRPAASMSEDATVGQILLHGSVHTIAGMHSIGVTSVAIGTLRKHFCGQASAHPPIRGRPRTSAERTAARRATKEMVIQRARLLGYISRNDVSSFEKLAAMADAACVYDWGKAHLGRNPGALHLFQNVS